MTKTVNRKGEKKREGRKVRKKGMERKGRECGEKEGRKM